jgi:hypothetical protein
MAEGRGFVMAISLMGMCLAFSKLYVIPAKAGNQSLRAAARKRLMSPQTRLCLDTGLRRYDDKQKSRKALSELGPLRRNDWALFCD